MVVVVVVVVQLEPRAAFTKVMLEVTLNVRVAVLTLPAASRVRTDSE